jgi:general stress protein 26
MIFSKAGARMSKDRYVQVPEAGAQLREIVDGIRFAMMTTVDAAGELQSRPMPRQVADDDGTLWFLAARQSSLTSQLREQPVVLITYGDARSRTYMSVTGTATVLQDPTRAAQLWDAAVRTWFPDGPDDPELAVIKVEVESGAFRNPLPAPVAFPQFMQAATSGDLHRARWTDRSGVQHAPRAQES